VTNARSGLRLEGLHYKIFVFIFICLLFRYISYSFVNYLYLRNLVSWIAFPFLLLFHALLRSRDSSNTNKARERHPQKQRGIVKEKDKIQVPHGLTLCQCISLRHVLSVLPSSIH